MRCAIFELIRTPPEFPASFPWSPEDVQAGGSRGKFWPVTHASLNRAGAPTHGVGAAPVVAATEPVARPKVGATSSTLRGRLRLEDPNQLNRRRPSAALSSPTADADSHVSRCGTGRPHSARRLRKIEDGKCREGFSKGRHRASMRPSAPPCGAYSGNISANTSPRS